MFMFTPLGAVMGKTLYLPVFACISIATASSVSVRLTTASYLFAPDLFLEIRRPILTFDAFLGGM